LDIRHSGEMKLSKKLNKKQELAIEMVLEGTTNNQIAQRVGGESAEREHRMFLQALKEIAQEMEQDECTAVILNTANSPPFQGGGKRGIITDTIPILSSITKNRKITCFFLSS